MSAPPKHSLPMANSRQAHTAAMCNGDLLVPTRTIIAFAKHYPMPWPQSYMTCKSLLAKGGESSNERSIPTKPTAEPSGLETQLWWRGESTGAVHKHNLSRLQSKRKNDY